MSIEQRLEQVERQTKRLRMAVVVLATALCGVVSMAATDGDIGVFSAVQTDVMFAKNVVADMAVVRSLSVANDNDGERVVIYLGSDGKDNGMLKLYNKTGESIINLTSDTQGNGFIGVWDGKGEGRALQPPNGVGVR